MGVSKWVGERCGGAGECRMGNAGEMVLLKNTGKL